LMWSMVSASLPQMVQVGSSSRSCFLIFLNEEWFLAWVFLGVVMLFFRVCCQCKTWSCARCPSRRLEFVSQGRRLDPVRAVTFRVCVVHTLLPTSPIRGSRVYPRLRVLCLHSAIPYEAMGLSIVSRTIPQRVARQRPIWTRLVQSG
jgi:hypothetical protein